MGRKLYTVLAIFISTLLALAAGAVAFFLTCLDGFPHRPSLEAAVTAGEVTMLVCFAILMTVLLLPLLLPATGRSQSVRH